jgi:predicted RecA/RadA family phage recombinase
MQGNFYKSGETLDFTASGALTDGEVVETANIPGIVQGDVAASGDKGVALVEGLVQVAKVTGAITAGQAIYWDENGSPVTGTASSGAATATASNGDFLLGIAVEAAASGASTVKVLLAGARVADVVNFGAAAGAPAQGLLGGVGTNADPATTATADKNFLDFRVQSTATTGTARGIYVKLLLGAATGGEALRAFTECSSNTPVDTVNGAHITLQFGASVGNVTGLATAARCTLMIPSRSLTGTTAAVMAELWADGASSTSGGRMSFLRACIGGNATGAALLDDTAFLLELAGGANGSGNICDAAGNEPTWSSATHKIRVCINGTTMYLVAVLA